MNEDAKHDWQKDYLRYGFKHCEEGNFNHWPASIHVKNGVSSGASRVVAVVRQTDKVTSPLARYVITLEAVPPGVVPRRIMPMASSGGSSKPNRLKTVNARNGMMVNCPTQPKNTS